MFCHFFDGMHGRALVVTKSIFDKNPHFSIESNSANWKNVKKRKKKKKTNRKLKRHLGGISCTNSVKQTS
jgi:ABC-type lipoprotein release transport system permease subunit